MNIVYVLGWFKDKLKKKNRKNIVDVGELMINEKIKHRVFVWWRNKDKRWTKNQKQKAFMFEGE